jgi:hypothetical protein
MYAIEIEGMEADPELNFCPASEIISALQNIVSAQLYT